MSNKRNQNEICLEKDKKTNNTSYLCLDAFSLLPPANEVWGKVIFSERVSRILSTGEGVVSQHALQQVSRKGWVVFQHALQVSRPTPRGEVEGDLARGGSPGPHPRGKLRGIWPGGSPGPHPRGKLRGMWLGGSPGPHLGGLQAHTQGVSRSTPWGVYPSMH